MKAKATIQPPNNINAMADTLEYINSYLNLQEETTSNSQRKQHQATIKLKSFNMMSKLIIFTSAAALLLNCCYVQALPRPGEYDAAAETRSFKSDLKEDGSYQYQYETSNGIAAGESGVGGYYASGSSSYYAPDGQLIQLSYTADENGFHPSGSHLPTPPPIPEAILKSLEYIRTHPHQEERQGNSGDRHYQPQQQQQQQLYQQQNYQVKKH